MELDNQIIPIKLRFYFSSIPYVQRYSVNGRAKQLLIIVNAMKKVSNFCDH